MVVNMYVGEYHRLPYRRPLSTMYELESMDQSLATDFQLHRLLLAKIHHVFLESGGECFGSHNLEYICSYVSFCCRRILEMQIIIFKCYRRQIYAFNPHKMAKKCVIYTSQFMK
jgi:hypothetical protein